MFWNENQLQIRNVLANQFQILACAFFWLSYSLSGNALGIWICRCGCSLFSGFSKSAGAHSTRSLKISGCKSWCLKELRVRAPAKPVLTHSLMNLKFKREHKIDDSVRSMNHMCSKALCICIIFFKCTELVNKFVFLKLLKLVCSTYKAWNSASL